MRKVPALKLHLVHHWVMGWRMNGLGECSGPLQNFNYDTFRKVYTFPNVCPELFAYYCSQRILLAMNNKDYFDNGIIIYTFAGGGTVHEEV